MKKQMILAALLLAGLLSACGSKQAEEPANVDLTALYASVEETCGWGEGYMVDIEGEMLESYYPGLSEIETEQLVAKMPMMSSVVNELVFLQCKTEEDAAKAAAILQDRVDTQAEGGAWYPESMEAWSNGAVIQQGTYVAMVASASWQDEITAQFNACFA
jgi:hypothetical protein